MFSHFPHGEKWEKSIWKEREKYSFPSLSIYFFPHFSPWEKMGKNTFFHGQKWGWTPPKKFSVKNIKIITGYEEGKAYEYCKTWYKEIININNNKFPNIYIECWKYFVYLH